MRLAFRYGWKRGGERRGQSNLHKTVDDGDDLRRREIHREDHLIESSGIDTNLFIGPAANWLTMTLSSSTVMAVPVPDGCCPDELPLVVPSLLVPLLMPLRFAIIGALEQRFKGESTSIVAFTRRQRSHDYTCKGRLAGQGARDRIKC